MKTLSLLALAALLVGCSGTTETNGADSQTAKDNFSRGLTPEETAKMGGGAQAPGEPAKTPAGG